jgi:hypothetical protein
VERIRRFVPKKFFEFGRGGVNNILKVKICGKGSFVIYVTQKNECLETIKGCHNFILFILSSVLNYETPPFLVLDVIYE